MQTGLIRELFLYNDWGRDKLFETAGPLSDARLDRPFEMGFGSLRRTLHHICGAERVWLNRWLGVDQPGQLPAADGMALPALLELARATAAERDAFLQDQTDASLSRKITFKDRQVLC